MNNKENEIDNNEINSETCDLEVRLLAHTRHAFPAQCITVQYIGRQLNVSSCQ